MTSPASPSTTDSESCPSCHKPAAGKFCSNCGGTLAGATCNGCGAALTPGAKFCHRCGTPAGAEVAAQQRGLSNALPWGVAGIALVALIALVAGQRVGRPADTGATPTDDRAGAPGGASNAPFAGATGSGRAPDISQMTPADAAERLYDRIMSAHERGKADTVQLFAPMAMTAYAMIGNLNLDQHYDVGRIAAVSGDESIARAEADTILKQSPTHLLGLILAENAASMRKDAAAAKSYHEKLIAAAGAERAKQLPEYVTHENDITLALSSTRP